MVGTGSSYVLDKGLPVLATYNAAAAGGMTANRVFKYRFVKFGAGGTIDLNVATTTRSIGVVQEDIDPAKVQTNKAVANVRMAGISRVVVQTATNIAPGAAIASGTEGGAVEATGAGVHVLGVCVGAPLTVTAGDYIEVLLNIGGSVV